MARAVGVSASWGEAEDQDAWEEGWDNPTNGGDHVLPNLRSVEVEILNSGPYPISGAVLLLAADDNPRKIVMGTILSADRIKNRYRVPRKEVVFAEVTGGAELHFTDSYGNHWVRSTGLLETKDAPARICRHWG